MTMSRARWSGVSSAFFLFIGGIHMVLCTSPLHIYLRKNDKTAWRKLFLFIMIKVYVPHSSVRLFYCSLFLMSSFRRWMMNNTSDPGLIDMDIPEFSSLEVNNFNISILSDKILITLCLFSHLLLLSRNAFQIFILSIKINVYSLFK